MNSPTAEYQLGFSLGTLTYIDTSYEEVRAPIVKLQDHGIGAWVARVLVKVAEWQRRRAVMREMSMMTDHELSDIGLSRSDLSRVFDPVFAADRAGGRDYVAY